LHPVLAALLMIQLAILLMFTMAVPLSLVLRGMEMALYHRVWASMLIVGLAVTISTTKTIKMKMA
jgi:hypothetical protein